MSTIFSQIVAGEIPAHFVFRAQRWVGFLDRFPISPGHLLLVPTTEVALVHQLPAETLADLGPLIKQGTACLYQALDCDAVSVLIRDGHAAGQEIAHVHVHLIPRRTGDVTMNFAPGTYGIDDADRDAAMASMADKLQAAWR